MIKNKQFFGIVEGYFAKPYPMWGWDDRNIILEQLSAAGNLNTYFYCPKDDPKVTGEWDKLYSPAETSKFSRFTKKCADANITFAFGLNPVMKQYKNVENDFESYVASICRKFIQLKDLGVDTFCILYDDIPLSYKALEGKTVSEALEYARTQCLVVNAVQRRLGEDCRLWFCSSEYFFIRENIYTKTLNKYLNRNVVLIWTGNKVFTKRITGRMLMEAKKVVNNRDLIWWDNYPVNDPMTPGFLNLGGFNEPDVEVLPSIKGILINPMREVSPNIPFLSSFSRYLKCPNKYSRTKDYRMEFSRSFSLDRKTSNTILEFSNRSEVDGEMKYGYKKLQKIYTDRSRGLFLKGLELSYTNIRKRNLPMDFKLVVSRILALMRLDQKSANLFPIPVDATYLNRVLLIVLLRFLLDLKTQKGFEKDYRIVESAIDKIIENKPLESANICISSQKFSSICELYNKYININKIELGGKERRYVEKTLSKLIAWENCYFKKILIGLNSTGRLRALSLRLNINQYRVQLLLDKIERFDTGK